jgi:hypothetical protein
MLLCRGASPPVNPRQSWHRLADSNAEQLISDQLVWPEKFKIKQAHVANLDLDLTTGATGGLLKCKRGTVLR